MDPRSQLSKLSAVATSYMAGTSNYPESPQERKTRELGNFHDFERTMPYLPSRRRATWIGDKITSLLGQRNPFSKPVDPELDLVWLFDNIAYQKKGGSGWEAEFVAAYFIKNSGGNSSRCVADIAEKLGVGEGDEAEATIAKRLQPFLDSILPARTVKINVAGTEQRLGPSNKDGISSQLVPVDRKFADGEVAQTKAINLPTEAMTTRFAGPTGWAVLSDIDDTIKKTLTPSPIGILQTTFVDDPEPIQGMPELYQHIAKKLDNPPFWYLSASPYNLYTFLLEFRNKYYPPGQLILRDASWMNIAGFLISLTVGTQGYKTDRMSKVHSWFPQRKFILIGDSTQTDPESYAEIYAKYPGWVKAIYIRKVTGIPEIENSEKNTDQRFIDAFEQVPDTVWAVFEDPAELYDKIDNLVASN